MTDDRDQSWRAFDDEPTEERLEDEPRWEPSTNSETGKTLSRVLRRHEKAIDRTLAAIDNAIDDLRDAAGESPQEQKSDPGPAFPWRGPEASEESAATASQSVRSESTSAGMAKADASSGADKHKSVPPDAAAKPAPQAEPKPTPATASQSARSEFTSAGMPKADASSGADKHKSMPPDAAAKPAPQDGAQANSCHRIQGSCFRGQATSLDNARIGEVGAGKGACAIVAIPGRRRAHRGEVSSRAPGRAGKTDSSARSPCNPPQSRTAQRRLTTSRKSRARQKRQSRSRARWKQQNLSSEGNCFRHAAQSEAGHVLLRPDTNRPATDGEDVATGLAQGCQ